jgi:hypothetical protein
VESTSESEDLMSDQGSVSKLLNKAREEIGSVVHTKKTMEIKKGM